MRPSPAIFVSDDSRQAQWQLILQLSHAMAAQADAKDWDSLMEMEARRRQLLAEFFASAPTMDEAATLATDLRALLDLDRRVMVQVQEARDGIGEALRGLNTGRQANQAYAKAGA